MAHTDHVRNPSRVTGRRTSNTRTRQAFKVALSRGELDSLPTREPSRATRTAVVTD